jgi:uncharacterized protein YbaP (TraB family)
MPFGQGLLWKVEKAGMPASHVLGTIHIADPRILDLPSEVTVALEESRQAIFEIVFDGSVNMKMAQAMVLTDGRTLEGIVGSELFQKAADAAAQYGLPAPAIQQMKPWALVPILSFPPEQFALVAGGQAPLDQWLQQVAAGQGTRLLGLETVEEQLSLFDGAPEEEQVAMLRSVVENREWVQEQFDSMIAAYLARDLSSLYGQMLAQATAEEALLLRRFEQDFVVERNRRMVQRLQPLLADGASFIAVGALHLPGDTGILALLADDGFQVSRVY